MKKIKKVITLAVAVVMAASFAGCNMVERTDASKGKTVLAKVGKTKITRDDVDKELKTMLDQYKQQYGDDYESNDSVKDTLKKYRQQQLDLLVTKEVLKQSEDKYGVDPNDDSIQQQVDQQIDQLKQQYGDQYDDQLDQAGYDEDSFASYLKENMILQQVYDAIVSDVDISDDDIQDYYNNNQDTYTYDAGADVEHLLFQPTKDSDGNVAAGADEAAKAKAEAARQEALAGKSLQEISQEDQFKDSCLYQDLGRVTFENNQMVQEFTDGFKNLPANQVSDLVKTSYGYHIIINKAVYPERSVEPLNDSLKQTISQTLKSQKEQDIFKDKLEELKSDLKVKTYEDKL